MLGYVPYTTTGFTDFCKPVIIFNEERNLKSVFGLLFSKLKCYLRDGKGKCHAIQIVYL